MEIVKAEILFSRKCKLSCSHCGMVNNKENTLSIEEWKKGILNLKEHLNCSFLAFYGAEPFEEFTKLKQVVGYAESIGIDTTVITSGIGIYDFRKKLKELNEFGARSLSMSYDITPYDESSRRKSKKTLEHLQYFKQLDNVRDVAAIVTLTSHNYIFLPLTVEILSEKGIWTFFDIIHADRGFSGTKCKGKPDNNFFEERHILSLSNVLQTLSTMKKNGFLIHNNDTFFEVLKDNYLKFEDFYNWRCADYREFPSWVTIDCDGTILPCDDFHKRTPIIKIHEVNKNNWEELFLILKSQILNSECRCCWNTHIGAHAIKAGKESITDYIHGKI